MLSQNNNRPVIYDVGDIEHLQALVLAAKSGDREAFDMVYTKLFTPLYRYVMSRAKDKEVAYDICQQAFLNFYTALPRYEPTSSPLAYLFTIAKRLLINHSEKKVPLPFDETLFETLGDDTVDIVDETHVRMLATSINDFLPALTEDEQDVVRLYFYGEFSHKEIAEILEREEAYVRKIKERALKKLRVLSKHLYEEN